MEKLDELMQQRAALVTEQRRLIEKSEAENRDLSAEEKQEWDRADAELGGLESRIERIKDHRERQRNLALAERGELREVRPEKAEGVKAYNEAFAVYLRHGIEGLEPEQRRLLKTAFQREETRDMSVGTAANGGYTVPEDFYAQIVNKLEEESGIRRAGARRLETANGQELPIPKVTAHANASWLGEAAAISIVDDTFAEARLNAHKSHKAFKVSLELLEDTGVDLVGYIASELGRAIGRLEGDAFATGDGVNKPNGLVGAATVGVTCASGTAITGDEIIDLVHSVSVPYRAGGAFLMNDGIVKLVRKLKDGNQQYLWQPGLQAGQPDRLLGYPIFLEPSMDGAPAVNDKVMVFGDISSYFIRDVRGFSLVRLNERYMDNMQVGFLGWHRTDGDLIDTNGVRVMQMAAV